jgi:hypothetical protein
MPSNTKEHALAYIAAGLSIVPLKCDGSKGPTGEKWQPLTTRILTPAEVEKHWGNGHGERGIGIVGGAISGNLERIDFDDEDAYCDWCWVIDEEHLTDTVSSLPLVKTPNGYHLYYRCTVSIPGNKKLAETTDRKTLIETRGEGGYTVAPGSPLTVHSSGQPYEMCVGDLLAIPTITTTERDAMIACACSLNEYIPESKMVSKRPEPGQSTEGRPGDDYNLRGDWRSLVQALGWAHVRDRGNTEHWRRPGKSEGISATFNHKDSNVFYVFSANGHPFETERGYDPFGIYVLLEHNGDFASATRTLGAQGYGSPPKTRTIDGRSTYEPEARKTEQVSGWPSPLAPEAFHGIAGEVVRMLEPHTEADQAALLINFLVSVGNMIGRKAHWRVGNTVHYCNLFACLVGPTSSGRKGTSWDDVFQIIRDCDGDWSSDRIKSGLSSGEGLIENVRDPVRKSVAHKDKETKETTYSEDITDPGIDDKRLLIIETEFARALKVLSRDGSTLSSVMRQCWDSGTLSSLTRNSPGKATGAHISIVGHITKTELLECLAKNEYANGFGNRFLWICCKRSKELPEGNPVEREELRDIIDELCSIQGYADNRIEFKRDSNARVMWNGLYSELTRDYFGQFGDMIQRRAPQVMRLACVYAVLDRADIIRAEHLGAALAVWRYCEDSAKYIFGGNLGNATADSLLCALRAAPECSMTRTEIRDYFSKHKAASEIDAALKTFQNEGCARKEYIETGGRPAEKWTAIET